MKSTKPPTRSLEEFHHVPLCSDVGSYSDIESQYVRKGLVPPLSEFMKTAKSLENILKPRPFVRPIVKRRARDWRSTQTNDCIASHTLPSTNGPIDGTQSLPTPPYEPDLSAPLPNLYEDLEGIADVAPGTPQPSLPSTPRRPPSPPPIRRRNPKPKKFWRKLTARKSTTPTSLGDRTNECRECSVLVVDLKTVHPAQTEKLLQQYYSEENLNVPRVQRSDSTDSGNATDETDERRLVPPLKIRLPKPTVHDVLGKIAICPSRVAVEESAESVQLHGSASPAIQAPAVSGSRSNALPTAQESPQNHPAPSRKRAIQPELRVSNQNGLLETEKPPAKKRAVDQGLEEAHRPPETVSYYGPVANISSGGLRKGPILIDALPLRSFTIRTRESGLKAPVKGLLKNNRKMRHSDNTRTQFLLEDNCSEEKAESLVSLPTDVIQTYEYNFSSAKFVPLSPKCQKEIALKEICPYPLVCIQCNLTFSSRMELATHALLSNHSSVFNY